MNEDTKFLRIFGSIFAGIGSIFAVTGIIIGLNTRSFVATAIPAQGTIIDLVPRSSTDSNGYHSSYVYYPVVKFTDRSGEPTVFESKAGSDPPAFSKGQQVEVLYNPQKPNSAMINSWHEFWLLPVIFTSLGLIFVLIGGIVLIKSFPRLMSFK
ncbi:hypothetical protein A6770_14365 [Nostoc minutum NIES-26]|uniref:DUF3592 domain-containing protein n=1 Tax=Nostoc minutum NIES-26 TaxID=1844469 RepID=A0A367RLG9_9NOSO|nr:hypothetical protein A6770_14365 [Nostoc minutum NIES-26]